MLTGHHGQFIFGVMGGKQVVCQRGRFHPYEGYEPSQCAILVRVMAALGIKMLVTTLNTIRLYYTNGAISGLSMSH